ncbi:MAG: CHAT domain-containing tetratricopeptide repeat protein [Bacteroidota bacterium]
MKNPFLTFLLFLTIQVQAQEDIFPLGETYLDSSILLFQNFDVYRALDYAQKSYGIFKRDSSQYALRVADAGDQMGQILDLLQQKDGALSHFQEGLSIREKIVPTPTAAVARSHYYLGNIHFTLRKLSLSLRHLEEAEQVLLEHADSTTLLGEVYNSLGNIWEVGSDPNLAILYFKRAQRIFEQSSNPNPTLFSSYINAGRLYSQIGELELALEEIDKAFRFSTGSTFEASSCLIEKGSAFARAEVYDSAFYYLDLAKEEVKGDFLYNQYPTYNNIGYVQILNKQFEQAIPTLIQARELATQTFGRPHHPEVARTQINLAMAYYGGEAEELAQKEYEAALEALGYDQKGLVDPSNISDLFLTVWALSDLGNLAAKRFYTSQAQSDFSTAQDYFNRAFFILRNHKTQLKLSSSRQMLWEQQRSLFERYIRLLVRSGEKQSWEEAWLLAEESRDLLIREAIQREDDEIISQVPDSLLNREEELSQQLLALKRKDFLSENSQEKTELQDSIFAVQEVLVELKETLRIQYPSYFQIYTDPKLISLSGFQEFLSPGQTCLEYFSGDSSLFCFLIQKDHLEASEIRSSTRLDEQIKGFRDVLDTRTPHPMNGEAREHFVKTSYGLYTELIAPFQEKLTGELTLIPDGLLNYIPFEVLLTQTPDDLLAMYAYPYLLREHEINYGYSATLLKQMTEMESNRSKENLLAFAPTFDLTYSRDSTLKHIIPLKYSETEVQEITQVVGGKSFIGSNATLTSLLKNATGQRVLHFSTHAQVNDQFGDYSYILFTQGLDSIDQDPRLFIQDLHSMKLPTEMVVLSACETGIGEWQKGEGILSLGRGFTYAGAKSIVNSLWKVNEETTALLMKSFYQNLQQNMSKSEALRQAKLSYLDSDNPADPFYWASFVAVGDMTPLPLGNAYSGWWAYLLLGMTIAVFGFWRMWKGS